MLQLQVAGGRKITSRQLLGLQAHEGAAEEEIAENTQNYNGKGVLLKPYYTRCLLCGGDPR
jgi:hypothetical protein